MLSEDVIQCPEMVYITGRWYQCTCFKGKGHDTSEYDHIVDAETMSVTKAQNKLRNIKVTVTWQ